MCNSEPVLPRAAQPRAMCSELIGGSELSALRIATETGAVLGTDRFRAEVGSTLQRQVDHLAVGGDRKSAAFKQRRSSTNN